MSFVELVSLSQFLEVGHGIVRVGTAPDGLPWYVAVPAPPAASELLLPVARALQADSSNPSYEGTPLEPIAAQVGALLRSAQLQHFTTPTGPLEARVLPIAVRALTGESLLARLVPAQAQGIGYAPLPFGPPPLARRSSTQQHPITQVDARDREQGAPRFVPANQCLGITVDGHQTVVLRQTKDARGWPHYELVRRFREERVSYFEGATFHNATADLSAQEVAGYRSRALDRAEGDWYLRVPRNALAKAVLEMALSLARLQASGEVHGDVKPSNALVSEKGIVLFDGLGLHAGDRSPAMTPGWAAPEQVLAKPVTMQTDHFPIGLMLLSILRGVAYGEELRVVVPVGGSALESYTLLRNGGAYVDPQLGTVDPAAIEGWRSVIERCLRFEPQERFPATLTLVDELRRLVERQALRGTVDIPLSFGRRILTRDSEQSPLELGWLTGVGISDFH